jgi:hypothetical protein
MVLGVHETRRGWIVDQYRDMGVDVKVHMSPHGSVWDPWTACELEFKWMHRAPVLLPGVPVRGFFSRIVEVVLNIRQRDTKAFKAQRREMYKRILDLPSIRGVWSLGTQPDAASDEHNYEKLWFLQIPSLSSAYDNDKLSRELQIVPAEKGATLLNLARTSPTASVALGRHIEEKTDPCEAAWARQMARLARSKTDLLRTVRALVGKGSRIGARVRVTRVISLGDIKIGKNHHEAVYRHNVHALAPGFQYQLRPHGVDDALAGGVIRVRNPLPSDPIILPDGWDTGGVAVPGATALLVKERL